MRNRQIIYYDITEVFRLDRDTGIQKVCKNIYLEITNTYNGLYTIIPMVWKENINKYLIVENFTTKNQSLTNEVILPQRDSIYLCADLNYKISKKNIQVLKEFKNIGINIVNIIYDIIPFKYPQWFVNDEWFEGENFLEQFRFWFDNISSISDKLACISGTTAKDVKEYLEGKGVFNKNIDYVYISSNIKPRNDIPIIKHGGTINFIMVGTVEPRKGYGIVLEAFEELFKKEENIRLTIVGKQGWGVDNIISKINNSQYLNDKLFWYASLDDDSLIKIYSNSHCLIAMSEYEGFGLPIIEAKNFGLPIIARDIGVFHEICGDFASYFKAKKQSFLDFMVNWIYTYRNDSYIRSDGMKVYSWTEATSLLLNKIIK